MSIPHLRLTGDYDINGKIMLVRVTGDGPFQMDVRDLKIFAKAALRHDYNTSRLVVGEMVS